MKVTMLLCDAAQVVDTKLYILGGGWNVCRAPLIPMALAIKLDVEWTQTDLLHYWQLALLDADGRPVLIDTLEGKKPIEIRGEFTVPRPTGLPEGSPVGFALAVNIGPIPLAAQNRYTWQLLIDGEIYEGASASFYVQNEN
jgi:hypothetical protein